jgi:hypothetical protein
MDLDAYLQEFRTPSAIYRPQYFWFWNHDMNPTEIRRQLHQMKDAGAGGAFIHARHGRITPYLSDRWLDLCAEAIRYGKELGLKVWLYDEDGFPSGFAGGKTLEPNPKEFAANFLVLGEEFEVEPGETLRESIKFDYETAEIFSIYAIPANNTPTGFELVDFPNATLDLRAYCHEKSIEWKAPECPAAVWLVCPVIREWNLNAANVLSKDAMNRFIQITHEKYAQYLNNHGLGEELGKTIPGIFTDEPAVMYCNGDKSWRRIVPYSTDLDQTYTEIAGIPLQKGILPVFYPLGDKTINWRLHYWEAASRVYSEAYFHQIGDWCAKHHIWSTGHLANDSCLFNQVRDQVDWFRNARYMHLGPSDQLGTEFRPVLEQNYNMGATDNMMTPKFAYSATRLYQFPRTMSECFGSAKWTLSLEEQKALVDWQAAQGIDLFIPHDFIYSLEGARKRDHPPSFNTCAYFSEIALLNDYIGRLCALFGQARRSAGETNPRIALLYANRSILANMNPMKEAAAADAHDAQTYLIDILQRLHRDFDIIPEDHLSNMTIDGSLLTDPFNRYSLLILAACETIHGQTAEKIQDYISHGGRVLVIKDLPARFYQASKSDLEMRDTLRKCFNTANTIILAASQQPIWKNHLLSPIRDLLWKWDLLDPGMRALDPETNTEIGDLTVRYFEPAIPGIVGVGFVANVSNLTHRCMIRFGTITYQYLYQFNLHTGEISPIDSDNQNKSPTISVTLTPHDSRVFVFTTEQIKTTTPPQKVSPSNKESKRLSLKDISVTAVMPPDTFNIINLNDWIVNYQTVKMGIERPSYLKYILRHEMRFEIDPTRPPTHLHLILDGDITHSPRAVDGTLRNRPQHFNIFINGTAVQKISPDTILDHQMLQTENFIGRCHPGINILIVETFGGLSSPMIALTEPVRLVGDFLAFPVMLNEKLHWKVEQSAPISLPLGLFSEFGRDAKDMSSDSLDLSRHGYPHYPFPLDYHISFVVPDEFLSVPESNSFWLKLPKSNGPLYKVWLNTHLLGHVWYGDFEIALRGIQSGTNHLHLRYYPFPDRLFESAPDYPLGICEPCKIYIKKEDLL